MNTKVLFSAFLSASFLLTAVPFSSSAAAEQNMDYNNDNYVDIFDLITARQNSASENELSRLGSFLLGEDISIENLGDYALIWSDEFDGNALDMEKWSYELGNWKLDENGNYITNGWDSKGGGNYLKIKHNSTYTTEYMHLRGFASGISTGTHVAQGQLIGYVGSTGMSTGPHLDFRVFKDGTAIDPLRMDLPAVDPIAPEDMPAYLEATRGLMEIYRHQ